LYQVKEIRPLWADFKTQNQPQNHYWKKPPNHKPKALYGLVRASNSLKTGLSG